MIGEILPQPYLRFNYASTYARDRSPKRGLKRFGPYDLDRLQKNVIKNVIFYPEGREYVSNILIEGLTKGESYFEGFERLFRIPIKFVDLFSYNENNFEILIENVMAQYNNIDLVYFLLEKGKTEIYRKSKYLFISSGIPSQMICIDTLLNIQGLQFILENIALVSYAKIGGIPWTISTKGDENILLMGISRTKDEKNFLVGFVTIFTYNGDFLLLNSAAPVIEWGNYLENLSKLVANSIKEFKIKVGDPSKIILHLSKKPGKGEINAIEGALEEDIPYALIHINNFSNFRVFDSTHPTYVPPKGLMVRLSSHEALLVNKGRTNGWTKIGVPRVLNVRMDKRSTMSQMEFLDLIRHIYDLSYLNWRGFNAESIPVTLNYSKLIARMIREIGSQRWNNVITKTRLRDKSWYL